MADQTEELETGRYESVPEMAYHGWDAMSNGRLTTIRQSRAHCQWSMGHPSSDTPSTAFGTAAHCVVLEPERWDLVYCLEPQWVEGIQNSKGKPITRQGWRNSTLFKDRKADLVDHGREPLSQADLDACRTIRDHLYERPSKARDIMLAKTATEVSYLATDPDVGVLAKVRPDIEVPSADMVVDFKTSKNAARDEFERSIYKFGYHRTSPFYRDVMSAEGSHQWKHYLFLVVENVPPFEVAIYDLHPDAVDLGRFELEGLKLKYAHCIESGEWPGYPDEIRTVDVPRWVYREWEGVTIEQ